jgi:hypothetical protein
MPVFCRFCNKIPGKTLFSLLVLAGIAKILVKRTFGRSLQLKQNNFARL